MVRLQESLRGEEQLAPATYDTLGEDIGEVLDREEKAASRGTAESEEKPASKGTSRSSRSVHFDSPDGQAEQLPEPSRPAVARAPPATWEASPGVTVDWNWRMAEPSVELQRFDIRTPRPVPKMGDHSSRAQGILVTQEVERLERALQEQRAVANAAQSAVAVAARRQFEEQRLQFERELALRKEREEALQLELRVAAEQARLCVAEATRRPSSAPSSAPEISGRVGSPRGLGSVVSQLLGVGKLTFQVETPEPSLRVSAPMTTLTAQAGAVSTLWKSLRGSRSSGSEESPQPLATGATSVEYLSRPP